MSTNPPIAAIVNPPISFPAPPVSYEERMASDETCTIICHDWTEE